jgi:hypothetical protein
MVEMDVSVSGENALFPEAVRMAAMEGKVGM